MGVIRWEQKRIKRGSFSDRRFENGGQCGRTYPSHIFRSAPRVKLWVPKIVVYFYITAFVILFISGVCLWLKLGEIFSTWAMQNFVFKFDTKRSEHVCAWIRIVIWISIPYIIRCINYHNTKFANGDLHVEIWSDVRDFWEITYEEFMHFHFNFFIVICKYGSTRSRKLRGSTVFNQTVAACWRFKHKSPHSVGTGKLTSWFRSNST